MYQMFFIINCLVNTYTDCTTWVQLNTCCFLYMFHVHAVLCAKVMKQEVSWNFCCGSETMYLFFSGENVYIRLKGLQKIITFETEYFKWGL